MSTGTVRTHNLPEGYSATLNSVISEIVPRILGRDVSVWSSENQVQKTIANRLGWLDSPQWSSGQIDHIKQFTRDLGADNFKDVVLLGMGGSSLAPEVCRDVFSGVIDGPQLSVLDDTHPEAIRRIDAAVDLTRTLFVVASKSGTTTETSCFQKYFFDRMKAAVDQPGKHFCAITDPDSDLAKEAAVSQYRATFVNPADIGGRYSAISYFGLVPAATSGIDIGALVLGAEAEIADLSATNPVAGASVFGALLGAAAKQGRDKLTLLFGEPLTPLGVWVEQLIAESTGKEGVGIVPVVDEADIEATNYSDDRVFVVTTLKGDTSLDARIKTLVENKHPVLHWIVDDRNTLGAQFLRWEMTTAIAGALLNINPFDEPNVTESKNKTRELLQADNSQATDQGEDNSAQIESIVTFIDDESRVGDYFAVLAYTGGGKEFKERLTHLRGLIGSRLNVATTLGYGPRFLHSTGQLHKGGADNGQFLQLVADAGFEIDIPDTAYGFAELNRCQALGDYQVLNERGRRVRRLSLGEDPVSALNQLIARLETNARTPA